MTPEIKALFQKFLAGRCSRPEAEQLLDHFLSQEGEEEMVKLIQQELDKPVVGEELKPVNGFNPSHQLEALRQRIRHNTPSSGITVRFRWLPYAAAVLVAASIVIWLYLPSNTPSRHSAELSISQDPFDVAPGGNRAILTLDNSSTIRLSESQEGIVIGDGIRYEDGTPIYENGIASSDAEPYPQYATLSTPNGGTYHITLSDGTQIWLNAASSLRYPIKFSSQDRVVELEGEAYFSVAPNSIKPSRFKVMSQGQEVEVLGTEFNISAYPGETIKTTLVDGIVQLHLKNSNNIKSYDLIPGQQATNHFSSINIEDVDVNRYIAWKTGMFYFKQTPFVELMNQIARWYDVEVVYKSNIPQDTFGGKIRRDVNLLTVLELLKSSAIDYNIDGNRLIIE